MNRKYSNLLLEKHPKSPIIIEDLEIVLKYFKKDEEKQFHPLRKGSNTPSKSSRPSLVS
jgi:hypothetical protein